METIIISIVLMVLFVITWIVIGCNGCSHDIQVPTPQGYLGSSRSYESERDRLHIASLQSELEYVKRSCRLHHQPPFLGCDGCHHTTRYFAQTVEQQKLADMLAKSKETAKQLVKDLNTF